MAALKLLYAVILAAILAIVALVSGCTFDGNSGANGSIDLTTPFGHLKVNGKIVPGSIPTPGNPAAQPAAPAPSGTGTDPAAPGVKTPTVALWRGSF